MEILCVNMGPVLWNLAARPSRFVMPGRFWGTERLGENEIDVKLAWFG
jgi:hypothetical protein